ncbi:MAG: TRAP transporter small permease [Geminicoccaceae bacterium]|nr:TRAP transporter small permease [Geminicoccaceae bacterium]
MAQPSGGDPPPASRPVFVRAMDLLYLLCMLIAGISIVGMALIIAWSVYTRYVLVAGSFWAEPISIMLAVQMTFFGAAACYRADAHISIDMFVRTLPARLHRSSDRLVDLLMIGLSAAMIVYGISLVRTTWFQVYPELEQVRVGAVYSALPVSGLVTLLFALERLLYGHLFSDRPAPEEQL